MIFQQLLNTNINEFFKKHWENNIFFSKTSLHCNEIAAPLQEWSDELLQEIPENFPQNLRRTGMQGASSHRVAPSYVSAKQSPLKGRRATTAPPRFAPCASGQHARPPQNIARRGPTSAAPRPPRRSPPPSARAEARP